MVKTKEEDDTRNADILRQSQVECRRTVSKVWLWKSRERARDRGGQVGRDELQGLGDHAKEFGFYFSVQWEATKAQAKD